MRTGERSAGAHAASVSASAAASGTDATDAPSTAISRMMGIETSVTREQPRG